MARRAQAERRYQGVDRRGARVLLALNGHRAQTKLDALFGSPARYRGQPGYSQSGRVRLWVRSVTTGFTGDRPFWTQRSSAVSESHPAANAGVPKFAWLAPGTR